jgi:hypothetical protein
MAAVRTAGGPAAQGPAPDPVVTWEPLPGSIHSDRMRRIVSSFSSDKPRSRASSR